MKIREVNKNKKQFISLLLLADEQESMVDRYLEKGKITGYFGLNDNFWFSKLRNSRLTE